jgi:hypothetical protein
MFPRLKPSQTASSKYFNDEMENSNPLNPPLYSYWHVDVLIDHNELEPTYTTRHPLILKCAVIIRTITEYLISQSAAAAIGRCLQFYYDAQFLCTTQASIHPSRQQAVKETLYNRARFYHSSIDHVVPMFLRTWRLLPQDDD